MTSAVAGATRELRVRVQGAACRVNVERGECCGVWGGHGFRLIVNPIDKYPCLTQNIPVIRRSIEKHLRQIARHQPVVTLTGPRQSGKTTLAKVVFRGKSYVSLESLDTREFASSDPRRFLAEYAQGAIIDEVQRAPDLLSYLQEEVDSDPSPGRFILTGSQNLQMIRKVSQSLAGRTALVTLLPCERREVERFPVVPDDLFESMLIGGYPAIHDRRVPASKWIADYVVTYLERDVRDLLGVGDLGAFQRFVRLAAGRASQVTNFAALGADAGISHNTASAWLSVLEASYLVYRLPAFFRNVGKRLVKAPKVLFTDSGVLCYLLGISTRDQLVQHPLRGAVFETWVIGEVLKARLAAGLTPNLYYYRDHHGTEVDLVIEDADTVTLVECKSGATVGADFFSGLDKVAAIVEASGVSRKVQRLVIYGGDASQSRSSGRVVPWHKAASIAI